MYEITQLCYVMDICILYRLYLEQNVFFMEELIGCTHANFHNATIFGCRNIAFQIWWFLCNPHRCDWPKTFCGRCIGGMDKLESSCVSVVLQHMYLLRNLYNFRTVYHLAQLIDSVTKAYLLKWDTWNHLKPTIHHFHIFAPCVRVILSLNK